MASSAAEVETRVLDVCKAFDKINAEKVRVETSV